MDYQALESLKEWYNKLEEELKNTIDEEEREDVKREMSYVEDEIKKQQELLDEYDYECITSDDFLADDLNEMRKLGEI